MASSHCAGKTVAYIDDTRLRCAANSIPVVRHRASLVHELIASYGLLERLHVVPCVPATEDEVSRFHSSDYIEYLKRAQCSSEEENLSQEQLEQEDLFGLGFDCPVLPVLWSTVRWLAGGSLTGARLLARGAATTVLNWCGGWHHAQRDSASGFCYVNDIVLAVMELRKRFPRVAYIDLDVHHGDGVENAFAFSRSVLTVSLHLKEDGFFPGTGGEDDLGCGEGRYCSLNVPYRPGITDDNMVALVQCIIAGHLKTFQPDCLVVQCGGDALALDKLGGANLSLAGYETSLRLLLNLKLPTLVLGGGGYSPTNVARLWTSLTAVALDETLDPEVPEHRYFEHYGPSFDLNITTSNRKNDNSSAHIEFLLEYINGHCEELKKLLPPKSSQVSKRPGQGSSRVPCYKTIPRPNSLSSRGEEETSYIQNSIDDAVIKNNTSDDTLGRSRTSDDTLGKSSTSDDILGKSSTSDDILVKSSTSDDIFVKSSTSDDILVKSSTSDDILGKSSTSDDILVKSGTSDDILVKSGTTDDILVKSGTSDDILVKSSSSYSPVFKSSTASDSTPLPSYARIASNNVEYFRIPSPGVNAMQSKTQEQLTDKELEESDKVADCLIDGNVSKRRKTGTGRNDFVGMEGKKSTPKQNLKNDVYCISQESGKKENICEYDVYDF